MNVQHLESLNDVVSGVTGIGAGNRPRSVFDSADEVVLVDLPPDDLRQRLHEGKVYIAGGPNAPSNIFPQRKPDCPARAGPAPHRRSR